MRYRWCNNQRNITNTNPDEATQALIFDNEIEPNPKFVLDDDDHDHHSRAYRNNMFITEEGEDESSLATDASVIQSLSNNTIVSSDDNSSVGAMSMNSSGYSVNTTKG